MAFDIRISGEHARVILSGDVDLQTTSDLKTEITKISGVQQLEIDASSVTYIDSSGVACLIFAYSQRAKQGARVMLQNPSEALTRVLDTLKFSSFFPKIS